MNYTGKFDAVLPIVGSGPHSHAHGHFETISPPAAHAPSDAIIAPDAHLLFNGDFKRSGVDLILSKDGHELLLPDYFKGEKRAALSSPDGAHLTGDIVNALTGHVEYSQAGPNASAGTVIGHVTKLAGSATAIRNGVSIILNEGDNVEKGDVVQSGSDSTLGITFIDGTVFGLSSNARMVLNEMVYDPNGSNNSSLLSLVAGTISFVAGETAKHGDMKVDTPVATMGIRGTAVLVEIDFEIPLALPTPGPPRPPTARFHVLVEPDGTTGSYTLFDKVTLAPIATVNQAGQQVNISQGLVSITTAPLSAEVQKLITDVFALKFTSISPKSEFAFGSSVNNLADIGPLSKTAGDTVFDLTMPGIGKGTASTASITDSAAEMLFFLHATASNVSTLIEDSVALNLTLSGGGTVIFPGLIDIQGATIALKSSTSNAHLPGFTDNISQIGTFAVGGITTDIINNTTAVGWSFTLPDSNPVLQSLAMGQILTQVYTITLNSGATQDVTVTLVGVNDIPTIVSSSNSTPTLTEDAVAANLNLSAVGTITFRDVDLIDTHHATVTLKSSTSSAHLPGYTDNVSQIGTFALTSGPSGVSEVTTDTDNTGTVGWSFTLPDNDPVLQSLAEGQTITQIYTVTITDNNGALVTKDVTVTLVGTNDTPVITAATNGAVTEDATTPNLSTTGTITFADVDKIDTHSVSAVADAGNTLGGTLTPVVTTDATGGVAGTVTWTYTVADNATDYLAVGQTATEKFTVTVSDGHGGTASQLVTITINGTNEAPTISAGSTTATGAFSEAANTTGSTAIDSANGSIAFADVDLSDAHTVSQAAPIFAWSGGTLSAGQISALTSASTLALTKTDSTGTGSGSVAWNYSTQDKTFDFLAAGQTLTVTYAVTVDDGHSGTTSQNVVVTVTGTNDAPVIGGVSTGAVTEDGPLTAGGALTITDVDSGQNHFLAVAPASLIGTYGTFTFDPNTGVWGYTLNNQAAESLPTGQVAHDKLTVTSADGTASQLIDVSITSTNDAPIVQDGVQSKVANLTANNGQLVFNGQYFFGDSDFTVSDPDGPHFGIAITSVDNAHGTWEYKLAGTTEWIPITLFIVDQLGNKVPAWLLLSADDKVRFNGDASAPIETMQFKAWDGSGVFTTHGLIPALPPADTGGSSAFSAGTYFAATKNDAPAGIAGEPINLGLTESTQDLGNLVTVTIKDLPSDWTINGGTHNADGSWTVQSTDPSSLTVTTPASFAGAVLLTVTEAVVQADGTTTTFTLGDNIEAYSQGSPIFAWSDTDFLTGSTGNDLFVFAQPIGHDTVYSFDAAHDQIDLVGYAGFTSFADIQAHLADDANGDAVLTLGDGQSIELQGVHAAALTQNNLVFNQTPALDNAATMTIGDGAMLPLSGTINNTGTIALSSTGDETDLQLIEHGVTLEGGGQIVLSDSDQNIISGTSSSVMLDNEDNTISGAGQLGNGELSLTNAGTIDATGTHALTIDTGSNWVFNSGVLEASGSGGLTVASSIANSGVLWANGSTLTVQGQVSGNGTATIDGTATLDLEASATVNVLFGSGAGTLKLGDSFHFNGTITGFGASDSIDLANVASATASISYHENAAGTGGTLAISDGAQTLELSLVGDYSADNFSIVPDPVHGTIITYVPHDLML